MLDNTYISSYNMPMVWICKWWCCGRHSLWQQPTSITVNHTQYIWALRFIGQRCLSANLRFIFSMNNLQRCACVLCREMRLIYVNINLNFTRWFLKIFRIVACVSNSCKVHVFFLSFYIILFTEMLHVYQRVQSIHKIKTGFLFFFW